MRCFDLWGWPCRFKLVAMQHIMKRAHDRTSSLLPQRKQKKVKGLDSRGPFEDTLPGT